MYTMWLCKITQRNNKIKSGIKRLDYMEVIYNDLFETELEEFARDFCKKNGFIFDKMIGNRYCLFKNSDYCLFFEEFLDEEY